MDIAFIRQKFNPFGGAELDLQNTINELATNSKFNITLLSRNWESENLDSSIKIHKLNPFYIGRTWRDFSFANHVYQYLQKNQFDIVQSNERIIGSQIFRAGDGLHISWLNICQYFFKKKLTSFSLYHNYQLINEKKLLNSKQLKTVICIAKLGREEVCKYYPECKAELPIFYIGVDLNKFTPRLNDRSRIKIAKTIANEKNNWSAEKLTLIFVGSGFRRKGLNYAIAAIANTKDIQLIIIGADKNQNRFKKMAENLKVDHRIYFAGGQKNVIDFYHSADALILPTIYDPFGIVVLEALACGLPVITTTNCGAKDLIIENQNGYIIDDFTNISFSKKIEKLKEKKLLEEMGKAAREKALDYSIEKKTQEIINFYKSY